MFFKTIIDAIPPLPDSITIIESYAKDLDVSFKQISQMLEKDPVLTSTILKAANLPIYGFSRQISTLETAVSLFGVGTIRGFVLAVYVRNNFHFTLEPYGITPQQFALTASRHHAFAMNWYFKSKPRLFDVLSPATFLSNLGQIFISQYLIQENKSTDFRNALSRDSNSQEIEKVFCGTSAVELTADVLEHWLLEPRLINTLRYANDPMKAPERDILCSQILQCIHTLIPYHGLLDDENIQEAAALVETYGLDLEGFWEAAKRV